MMKRWLGLCVVLGVAWYLLGDIISGSNIAVLNPKGWVAHQEKGLLILTTLLMLVVVVPVLVLMVFVSVRYREKNNKAKYDPSWDNSLMAEIVWWGIPFIIVAWLGMITWKGCHDLDPFKRLDVATKPLKVQVVALQWKWLFLYPEQGIATVNFLEIPEKTPIDFEVTSDAPMNSFWIPQLGGQIYAMPGMNTQLHLIADQTGEFDGCSANLSGKGFASMRFVVKAASQEEFSQWVQEAKSSTQVLMRQSYEELAKPSEQCPVAIYLLGDDGLYEHIVMKYMMPEGEMKCLEN